MDDYQEFISSKRLYVKASGPDVAPEAIHPMLKPFQRDLTRWAIRKGRTAIFADTGLGKAQPIDEPVLTPQGWASIGSLHVGDTVIGGDGKSTVVTGVYPQGQREIARIHFSDGASTEADYDHLWTVTNDLSESRGQAWRVMSTRQIAETLRQPVDNRARWRVPTASIELPEAILPIAPYVLGILLGDGCLTGSLTAVTLTTADPEIVERINERLPERYAARDSTYSDRCPSYRITRTAGNSVGSSKSSIIDALRNMGLWGCSAAHKFIPTCYMMASETQRLDLLHGLMDSDGWTGSATQFTSISEQLALDVQALVRSLGGVARLTSKIPTFRDANNRIKAGQRAYNVTVKMPVGINPFALQRKAEKYAATERLPPVRKITNITPAGIKEAVCIQVAAEHHTYVTKDYIVTHNTFMQLEWARLIGHRILIVAPLSVARQTVREARKIGIDVYYTRNGHDIRQGVNITNYEQVENFDAADFDAVVLDESSILKSLDGKTRQRLTEMFADTPYRLCCTATPAPNDIAEIANHAEFLGIMSRADMLATFFVHDDEGWRLKGHAKEPFFKWLASWSMSVRKPSDLGYSDDGYILPPLTIKPVWLQTDFVPEGQLFYTDLDGLKGRLDVRKATIDAKVQRTAEIVNASAEQWIVWCGLNEEANALARLIPGSVNVQGSDTPEDKARMLEAFQDGAYRVLITKAKIAGFGMNFQNAHEMAFVGLSDSWEAYYQCIRRQYRFGQTQPVNVSIILTEQEEPIYNNVMRKEKESAGMAQQLIDNVQNYERDEILAAHAYEYKTTMEMVLPAFILLSVRPVIDGYTARQTLRRSF